MDGGTSLLDGKPSTRIRVLKHLNAQHTSLVQSLSRQNMALTTSSNDDGEEDPDEDPNKPKPLEPGMMQLYSYYAPSLQGGQYTIQVQQKIQHPDDAKQKLELKSAQKFNVNSPRFTLPAGVVHSTYPPQGLGDHSNILPHIVFEDPHLPWEQEGSPRQDKKDRDAGGESRNRYPWLALLTFTEDELKLTDAELKKKGDGGLFPNESQVPPKSILAPGTPQPPAGTRDQNKSTFSVILTLGEYLEMGGLAADGTAVTPTVTTALLDEFPVDQTERDTQVEAIFLKASQANDLLSSFDDQGSRVRIPSDKQAPPDLSRYQYLAHVRNVNTKNVAGAGLDDNGLYSVVHAHRAGPLNLKSPKPVIVHLVSLEGLEAAPDKQQRIMLPLDPKKRIGFISLYSWTYLCLPEDHVNFVDSMRDIGASIEAGECWLRAPTPVINAIPQDAVQPPVRAGLNSLLVDRMKDGYCLQRYMLQTGEETVAFYRGPLTPNYVSAIKESWWPYQSNFSTDYQVLDRSLGVMDISYSAAWQLGRTLGIADQAFTAALVRLRGFVHTTGRRGAYKAQSARSVSSKAETLAGIKEAIATIASLGADRPGVNPAPLQQRHRLEQPRPVKFGRSAGVAGASATTSAVDSPSPANTPTRIPPDEAHAVLLRANMKAAALKVGGARPTPALAAFSTATVSDNDEVYLPFNEINIPNSPDWQIVQNWILDNMFLRNIPAHYLIPDPSYLPPETIRFFYIDNNWMDAFIDGALSIGNHLDRGDDVVRQAFKDNLNNYFKSTYHQDHPELTYHPQIPCFGFLLRSAVVKAFPDLEIHAPWASTDSGQGVHEPTLRFDAIEKDTLLCLFDRMPGQGHWDDELQITLSQPPHQQCFRLGTSGGLDPSRLEVEFRAVYTTVKNPPKKDEHDSRYDPLRTVIWKPSGAPVEMETDSTGDHEVPVKDVSLPRAVYDWDTRSLVFPAFANASRTILAHDMTRPLSPPPNGPPGEKFFDDDGPPTSAMTGSILTSYISKMLIEVPKAPQRTGAPSYTEDDQPPDYTVHPRQIRLPPDPDDNPDNWVIVPHPKDDDDTPGKDPPAGAPAHGANPSRPPGPVPRLPSGFNPDALPPIPAQERSQIKDAQKKALRNPVGQQFRFTVFPLTSARAPPASALPALRVPLPAPGTAEDRPADLVVGLALTAGHETDHRLQLYSVEVSVPVGDKATDLLRTPEGGGRAGAAGMLRNLRFNVHCANVVRAGQAFLTFTLIPRSTGKLVPLARTPELSFVIWQVRLSAKPGLAQVTVRENYRRQNFDEPGPSINFANGFVNLQKVAA